MLYHVLMPLQLLIGVHIGGISFDPPSYFQAESSSPSAEYARFLWNGLDPVTRKGYK
jgi:hypothetical protein